MTTTPQDELLARFSVQIDLPAYLGQRGYQVVDGSRNPTYIAMADKESKEILFLRKIPGGSASIRTPRDPRDRGSVIDYLERHESDVTNRGSEASSPRYRPTSARDVPEAVAIALAPHESLKSCAMPRPGMTAPTATRPTP